MGITSWIKQKPAQLDLLAADIVADIAASLRTRPRTEVGSLHVAENALRTQQTAPSAA
jgi:hypothetical protein